MAHEFIARNGLISKASSTVSGSLLISGSVGIGTSNPGAKLNVVGSADVLVVEGSGSTANTTIMAIDGNNGRLFEVSDDLSDSLFSVNTVAGLPVMEAFADNRVVLGAYNQNDLVISGSRVGIGSSAPAAKLDVSGSIKLPSATGEGVLFVGGSAPSGLTWYNAGGVSDGPQLISYGSAHVIIDSDNNDNNTRFFSVAKNATNYGSATELFRVQEDGNVGIGTTSPGAILHLKDSDIPTILFEDASGGTQTAKITYDQSGQNKLVISTQYQSATDLNLIQFAPADSVAMTIRGGTGSSNGFVGIGTTSPTEKLTVEGSISASGALYLGADVSLYRDGINILRTDDIAHLNNDVHVQDYIYHRGDTDTALRFLDDGIQFNAGGLTFAKFSEGTVDETIFNPDGNTIDFAVSGSSGVVLYASASGNVGIGTTGPARKLHIGGAGGSSGGIMLSPSSGDIEVQFQDSGTTNAYITLKDGTQQMRFRDDSANVLNVDFGTERVGIMTTSPSEKLTVQGNISASGDLYFGDSHFIGNETTYDNLLVQSSAGENIVLSSAESIHLKTGGTSPGATGDTKMFISSSGNVGIGTTAPSQKLQVNGNSLFAATTPVNPAGGTLEVYNNGSRATLVVHEDDGTSEARIHLRSGGNDTYINNQPGFFEIRTEANLASGNAPLKIATDGNVTLGYNLVVEGSVTAQEFHTEFVSASIIYQSGSTKFGNSSDDVHLFTGTVGINHYNTTPDYTLDIRKEVNNNDDTTVNIRANWANTSTDKKIGSLYFSAYDADVSSGAWKTTAGIRSFAENEWTSTANANAYLTFSTLGANSFGERMRITSAGNVGIGTTAPTTKLHVTGVTQIAESGNSAFYGGNYVRVFNDQNFNIRNVSGTTVANISVSGNSYFNGGNVGIGTTSPATKLHIVSSSSDTAGTGLLRIEGGGGGGNVSWTFRSTVTNNDLTLDRQYAGAYYQALTFQRSTGNVGIGTTAPSSKLTVEDTIGIKRSGVNAISTLQQTGAGLEVNAPDGYHPLIIKHNGTEYVRFRNDGNVGIGTTTPSQKLTVEGNISSSGYVYTERVYVGGEQALATNSGFLYVDPNTSYGSGIYINNKVKVDGGLLGSYNEDLQLRTGDTTRLTLANADGAARLHAYGQGNFTANSVYRLAVDASGNIIEESLGDGAVNGLGASRYITRWADTDSLTTSSMYEDEAGNVGIGTTVPNQLLHTVGGTVKVESDGGNAAGAVLELKHANNNTTDVCATINFTNNIGGYAAIEGGTTGANNTGYLAFKTDNAGTQGEAVRILGNGNVGIGTTAPDSKFHVVADNSTIATFESIGSNANSKTFIVQSGGDRVIFDIKEASGGAATDLAFELGNSEVMRLADTGNVGIGTTDPTRKLTVMTSPQSVMTAGAASGHFLLTNTGGSSGLYGLYGGVTTDGDGWFQVARNDSATYYNLLLQATGGNVGIGTTSPSKKLHIVGDVLIEEASPSIQLMDTTNNADGSIYLLDDGTMVLSADANNEQAGSKLLFYVDGTEKGRIDSNGTLQVTGGIISGDLTVGGIVTAQEFHTEFVSASIIYQSGSTQFGNSSDDTHIFTGNVSIGTGSADVPLQVNNDSADTIIRISKGSSTIGNIDLVNEGNRFSIQDDGARRFNIDTNGNVGIGSASPVQKLDVVGKMNITDDIILAQTNGRIDYDNGVAGSLRFFSTSGSAERMRIKSDGNLGIGTASPAAKLSVELSGAANQRLANFRNTGGNSFIEIQSSGNGAIGFWTAANNAFSIYQNATAGTIGTSVLYVDASANVGIGTTSPSARLHSYSLDGYDALKLERGAAGGGTGVLFENGDDEQARMWLDGNQALRFDVGSTIGTDTKVLIQSNGNVGIGTTSPSYALDIERTTGEVAIQLQARDNSSNTAIYFGDNDDADVGSLIYNQGSNYMSFTTNAGERMRITSAGRVGIGTTAPTNAKVHIVGDGSYVGNYGYNTLTLEDTGGYPGINLRQGNNNWLIRKDNSQNLQFVFSSNATGPGVGTYSPLINITSSGNVGIGTTAPTSKLHISNATGNVTSEIQSVASGANAILKLTSPSNNWQIINDGTSANLDFQRGGSSQVYFKSDGNVGIGTTAPSYKLDISTAQSSIRVTGASTGYTQGSIIFQSSTTDNPGLRGLGVYLFNEGTDATWFYGTGYGAGDTFLINRKSGATYQASAAAPAESSNFFAITNAGNVGIGTTSPDRALMVSGSIGAFVANAQGAVSITVGEGSSITGNIISLETNSTTNTTRLYNNGTGTDFNIGSTGTGGNVALSSQQHLFFKVNNGGDVFSGTTAMYVSSSGNVGIGTTSPLSVLNINAEDAESVVTISRGGTTPTTNTAVGRITFKADYSGIPTEFGYIYTHTNDIGSARGSMDFGLKSTSGTVLNGMTLYGTNDGVNVGIGTTSPGTTLDVNGIVRATEFRETSARKYKTDIRPLSQSLEKVEQLQGVSFVRIGDEKQQLGFIADEVANIYPELVSYNENGEVEALQYARITAVLVESVKELSDKVKAQDLFIKDLVARIEKLENK